MNVVSLIDHIGCITRSAWDTAVLECISGWDISDESSVSKRILTYTEIIEQFRDKEISVEYQRTIFFDYLHSDVRGLCTIDIYTKKIAPMLRHIS
jgi:hypothetical protein